MAEQHTKDMTKGRILPLILSFSLPLLSGNLFQQTYNIVDTAIVGQTLGKNALAAVGSSASVQFLVLGFCQGLCLGFNIPIGQRFGAKDTEGMHRYEYNGSIMAAGFALGITLITAILCKDILTALQVPAEIMDDAWHYLFFIFLEIPFTIMYNWLAGMMRAIGDSRTPFLFLAAASLLNIGLDFLFILSFHMGVSGAAIATVLSQAVSGFLCLFAVKRSFPVLKTSPSERHLSRSDAAELLRMGIPMGLQWSIVAIGSMIMQGANNSLGTKYVSAFTAGAKIKQFVLCPFDALATAVSTFVSQNYGAKKTKRIHKGIGEGAMAGVVYGIAAGLVMIFLGRKLCLLFLNAGSTEELDFAALYLRRMGYCFWVLGILNVFRMGIQGMGFANRAMIAGLMEMAARTFVSLTFVGKFGYDAITVADQSAWFSATAYVVPMCLHSLHEIEDTFRKEEALDRLGGKA